VLTFAGLLRLTLASERLDVTEEEDTGRARRRPFEPRPKDALGLGIRLADDVEAVDLSSKDRQPDCRQRQHR
jgi:hypothetical protein